MLPIKEIRASSMSTIMNCSGPIVLKDQLPDESNNAAEEGTAAGELLRAMLEQRNLNPNVNLTASNGVRFDEDMYHHLKPLAQDVFNRAGHNKILCETRIDFMTSSGILLRGQYDVSYFDGHTLFIDDLKYGYGIVEVEKNWQLITYTIGEMTRIHRETGNLPQNFELRILQPRAYHQDGCIRTWKLTLNELSELHLQIQNRFMVIAQGDKTLATGKHCRYCKARPVCPAFNAATHDALEYVLEDWVQDSISNEHLSKQLDIAERAMELLKTRIDSLNQLGVVRVRDGQIIPGRGMKETFGHRKWKKNVTPESFKMLTGVDITETKIMSPAAVEKLNVNQNFIDMLTERPRTDVKLGKVDSTKLAEKAFGNIINKG